MAAAWRGKATPRHCLGQPCGAWRRQSRAKRRDGKAMLGARRHTNAQEAAAQYGRGFAALCDAWALRCAPKRRRSATMRLQCGDRAGVARPGKAAAAQSRASATRRRHRTGIAALGWGSGRRRRRLAQPRWASALQRNATRRQSPGRSAMRRHCDGQLCYTVRRHCVARHCVARRALLRNRNAARGLAERRRW